ncbi:hypothetical protein VSR69_37685 [Paraburkholderia phytofirmans]|jgi:hypothetical protein|uniref:hypothetical protein n=1 Tax=Paraburkholderia sp. BL9I2N2 TaxID=1938809 RepID=UPI001053AD40|nr:hypothetical protein [Paraburkholderia sp. BL9I2N2]TCK88380.1 hypothetical protein B0G74_6577 [Paraburkholderia sp. BL9I2N2]
MNYDSSKSTNIGRAERTNDNYDGASPSEEVAQAVGKKSETARNWAWAHSNESYDWMDSHSLFNTRDSIH